MIAKINPTLISSDIKNFSRDKLMLFISFLPIFLSFLFRFVVPPVTELLMTELSFDLKPYYGLIVITIITMTPLLFGWVVGFILLDNRDEHVLETIAITPLTKQGYLFYRVSSAIIVSFILAPLVVLITGLVPLRILSLLGVSLCAAMSAPLFALLLAALAKNKVEGMAIGKFLSMSMGAPLAAYLIKSPWQLVAGIHPSYWPARMFLAAESGDWLNYGLSFAAAMILQLAFLVLLLKAYNKKIG